MPEKLSGRMTKLSRCLGMAQIRMDCVAMSRLEFSHGGTPAVNLLVAVGGNRAVTYQSVGYSHHCDAQTIH